MHFAVILTMRHYSMVPKVMRWIDPSFNAIDEASKEARVVDKPLWELSKAIKFEGVVKVFAELAFLQPPPVTNVTMRAGRVEGGLVQMNVGHVPHEGAPFRKDQVPIIPTCLCTPIHMRPNRLHPGKKNLISSLACCSHLAYDTWKRHMLCGFQYRGTAI